MIRDLRMVALRFAKERTKNTIRELEADIGIDTAFPVIQYLGHALSELEALERNIVAEAERAAARRKA